MKVFQKPEPQHTSHGQTNITSRWCPKPITVPVPVLGSCRCSAARRALARACSHRAGLGSFPLVGFPFLPRASLVGPVRHPFEDGLTFFAGRDRVLRRRRRRRRRREKTGGGGGPSAAEEASLLVKLREFSRNWRCQDAFLRKAETLHLEICWLSRSKLYVEGRC